MPSPQLIHVLVASENHDSALAFSVQYTLNHFVDRPYDPFIGEQYRKQVVIDDRVVWLDIESEPLPDMEYYNALYDLYLKRTNVYIFIYDVAADNPQDGLDCISRLYFKTSTQYDRNKFLGTTGDTQKPAKDLRFSISQASGVLQGLSKRARTKIRSRDGPLSSISEHKRQQQPRLQNTFTLFPRLPTELQIAVLRACVTSPHPIVYNNPGANGINMNVLQTCKLFHEEGTKIFHAENKFISHKPFYIVADTTWIPTYPMTQQHRDAIEKGRELAKQLGCKFMQSSSRQLREVEAVFVDAVREFRAQEQEMAHSSDPDRHVNSRPENLGMWPGSLRSATRSIKARLFGSFRR
ncbi:hypothetical protein FQN50_006601 [Emmonsiellopsis sp. PD_5]|nr:hypothetical protein FQN50_006601 [Emmonsiellopsis sp. PD_5]